MSLADEDGSESLSFVIDGLPPGYTFSFVNGTVLSFPGQLNFDAEAASTLTISPIPDFSGSIHPGKGSVSPVPTPLGT